ncbi:MAG: exporter [Amycolatopsis sp.]|uniref:MDR family MFS transporter n=1 Tax=Amycolatopsis sp. TaxID=37632 RepID=UPI002627EBC6|nr:MDR family MFS transporter [Amycolatopsis sp.]MCU1681791.1 exporter [Amycolatopsis sp.]
MSDNSAIGTAPAPAAPVRTQRQYYLGVLALALGLVLSLLDQVIVNTALPTIVGDLGGVSQLAWVVTAYLVATSATTPLWGKLGDLYGRRATYTASISIFVLGSILAGLSQNMDQLIGFRVLQGLGSGGLMVGAFALIGDLVSTPAERAKLLAVIGGIMPAALAAGPLLGGILTQQASWRWAFYINLPLAAIALVATALGVPASVRKPGVKIDLLGGGLLTGAIVAITLLASWAGTRYPWGSPQVVGLAVAAVVLLLALPFVERRAVEPILPPRLFRSRDFNVSQVLGLFVGASMLGSMVYLPQYMQDVRNASPTASGLLLLLPYTAGLIGVELIVARIMARTGNARPFPIIGGAVAAAGILLLLVLDTTTNVFVASGLTLVAGVGIGLILQATQMISFSSIDRRDIGAASGLVNLFRTVGGSLGVAVFGSVYTARLLSTLTDRLGQRDGAALASSSGRLGPAELHNLPAASLDAFQHAVSDGLHGVLIGASVIAVASFALAWLLKGELRVTPSAAKGD